MSSTPFQDTARRINKDKDFLTMSVESGRARSHGWWKNLVDHGAWKGPNNTRVGPPDPEALEGIAKLFGMTERQVAEMVATDWYGVHPNRAADVSPQVRRLGPVLDQLSEKDFDLIENLVRRLATRK
jgi:hypothetical protein